MSLTLPSVPLLRSFGYALAGLGHLVRTERNFRIEVAIGLAATGAGLWWRIERWEWAVLLITTAIVLALEAVNTALENAVAMTSPTFDPRAKAAKDVAAASVLVAALASVAVGIMIFGPRLTAMLVY